MHCFGALRLSHVFLLHGTPTASHDGSQRSLHVEASLPRFPAATITSVQDQQDTDADRATGLAATAICGAVPAAGQPLGLLETNLRIVWRRQVGLDCIPLSAQLRHAELRR
jgi:hypothetical protein